MTDIEKLLAIEEIKQLKARYCRAIDEKKLQDWHSIFSADAVALTPQLKDRRQIQGVDAMIDFTSAALDGAITVHHLHAPEIHILGDGEALGIWAMEDNIYWTTGKTNFFGAKYHFRGAGFYREKYRKTPDGWRISETRLERLYSERDGEPIKPA